MLPFIVRYEVPARRTPSPDGELEAVVYIEANPFVARGRIALVDRTSGQRLTLLPNTALGLFTCTWKDDSTLEIDHLISKPELSEQTVSLGTRRITVKHVHTGAIMNPPRKELFEGQ